MLMLKGDEVVMQSTNSRVLDSSNEKTEEGERKNEGIYTYVTLYIICLDTNLSHKKKLKIFLYRTENPLITERFSK
jgi:hypothetical protein